MTSTAKKYTDKSMPLPKEQDAIAFLCADHKLLSSLFAEYEKTQSTAKKKQLVSAICSELSIHAQIEEEIFYPEIKTKLKDKTLIPEAIVEHATLKALISQVEGVEPDGEMFDAKIKVLCEYVEHHVKEEESEIFPKAKDSGLDMKGLGFQLSERKAKLVEEKLEEVT